MKKKTHADKTKEKEKPEDIIETIPVPICLYGNKPRYIDEDYEYEEKGR